VSKLYFGGFNVLIVVCVFREGGEVYRMNFTEPDLAEHVAERERKLGYHVIGPTELGQLLTTPKKKKKVA